MIGTIQDVTDRKKAQEELQQSEEKYRRIVEDQTEFLVRWLPDGTRTYVNDSYCRYFGTSHDEAIGTSFFPLITDDYLKAVKKRIESATPENSASTGEHKIIRSDGTICWNQWTDRAIFDEEGRLIEFQSVGRDVTERKQAEEQLAIFKKFAEASTQGLGMANLDGRIVYCNDMLCYTFLGEEEPRKALGKHISCYYDEQLSKKMQEQILPLVLEVGQWTGEIPLVSVGGKVTEAIQSIFLIRNDKGEPAYFANVVTDISERKRAEASVRESEEKYRSLIAHIPDVVWTADQNGNTTFISQNVEDTYGYNPEEIYAGQDNFWFGKIHPDDVEKVTEAEARLFEEGTPLDIEYRMQKKSGEWIWLQDRSTGTYEKDGVKYADGVFIDITKRKQAEEAVRNIAEGISAATGEVFFRLLVQYLARTLDADYALVGELSGEQGEKIRTLAVCAHGEIIDNIEYELANTPCEKVVGNKVCSYPRDVQAQFPLDKMFEEMGVESYIGSPLFDSAGCPLGIAVVLDSKPLSNPKQAESMLQIFAVRASAELERKKAETALAESEQRFRKFFEYEPEYCYIISPQGTIVEVNSAALNVLGYSKEELIGKPLETIYATESYPRMHQLLTQWENTGEIRDEELVIITKNGDKRTILLSATQVLDENEKPLHSVSIQRDITERKQAEKQAEEHRTELLHVSRLSTVGEMASGFAHELNQPLSAILSFSNACLQLIKSGMADNDKITECLETISSQTKRAGEVTRRIRNFIQKRSPHRSTVDIHNLLRDVVGFMDSDIRHSSIKLNLELADDIPVVFVDAIQIEQVLLNLVRNAIEAMRNIDTENRRLTIQTSPGDNAVEVTVSDTGIGLPEQEADRIFDPFFTTKTDGLGVGLSISRTIIEAHDGNLWVKSNRDSGAEFGFVLPVSPEHSQ
jgi:PAS domain S-box-containing protein